MNFGFTEEQELLRKTARGFIEDRAPIALAREFIERGDESVRALWSNVSELGWTGLGVAEAHGGAGLGAIELCILLEELGRNLAPLPFLSHAIATVAVQEQGNEAQRAHWLPRLASGKTIGTLPLASLEPRDGRAAQSLDVEQRADGYRLRGEIAFVPDAARAGLLVLPVRAGGCDLVFAVPCDARGLRTTPMQSLDLLRPLSQVALDDVTLPADALLGGGAAGQGAFRTLLDRALLLLSAEMLGGAERCLELSVRYAKERVQFGKPIGIHQAIKHKCADMLFAVEAARSIVYYAAWAARERHADASVLAAMAKATAGDAFRRAAADNLQIHGGVGFTWEYDCHLYLRRARSDDTWFGPATLQRERIADHVGLGASHSG
jgi:alkylation response protein AidB-like acyl-CoA dehydrogenase